MKNKPIDIAVNLYKIAAPIFASLREEYSPAIEKARAQSHVKELTFNQLRILLAIRYGKNQVSKLARGANVAQPAMSRMVDNLATLDLLEREQHPNDRRRIQLRLTDKGIAMTDRVLLNAAEKYVGVINDLSVSDQKKLIDGLAVIFHVLEKANEGEADA